MSKILHVVNIYFVLPYFIGDQFKYFNKKGCQQFVVCSPSLLLSEYSKKQGFQYKEIPVLREINVFQDLKSMYQICKYIKSMNIDIVVGHTPKGGLLAMLSAKIMRVPTRVYFRHGLVYETSTGIKRFLLKSIDRLSALCATKVICVSPSVYKRSLEDQLNTESKQIVLGKGTCTGIDVYGKFDKGNISTPLKDTLRAQYSISDKSYVIGYCGRLVRDKGILELLDAFKLVSSKYDNVILFLVGMFEERDALPAEIKEYILNNDKIIYTGFVNDNIEYYYDLMDVYVLPSYREGFPTSVLEASSMCKPIITTRVTGCIDSIIDGETGFFVDHDPQMLANRIEVLRDSLLRESMGKNAREFVVENFENQKVWRELEKIYV